MIYIKTVIFILTTSNTLTKILFSVLFSGIIPVHFAFDQLFLIIVKIYAMLFINNSNVKGTN